MTQQPDPSSSKLLAIVTHWDFVALPREQQRFELLNQILQLTRADAGYWRWGRGNWSDELPITSIKLTVPDETEVEARLEKLINHSETDRLIRAPLRDRLQIQPYATLSRSAVWSDAAWFKEPSVRNDWALVGFEEWLVGVYQFESSCWTEVSLFKSPSSECFDAASVSLVNAAIQHIGWLRPRDCSSTPVAMQNGLGKRQRAVMTLLLDGLPRKEIASRLGLSTHTVDDHCKKIYTRFQVNSATELAARFLRSF